MSVFKRFGVAALVLTLGPSGVFGQAPTESSAGPGETLTLEEAVRLALEYHPSVGVARAQREGFTGAVQQARGSRFPLVSTDASLSRYQEPSLVAPLHGFDPTMAPSFDRNLVRGNLLASYSIYDGGARAGRIGQAQSGEAMAVAGVAASQIALTAQVSAAYLDILSSADLLAAAGSQRGALEAERDRVRQFLDEGKAARVDLLRVQAALSQSEAVEISLRSRMDVAQGRLGRLTGLSWDGLRSRPLASLRLRSSAADPLPEATAKARRSNPELEVARQRLAVASAGVQVADANWRPTVQAAGAYSDFGTLDGDHTLEWQGSLRVSLPLFTGGALKGERERASAEERGASEEVRLAELAVEDGVEEAVAALSETGALRSALERGVEQAEEVARIEALALEVGSGVQTDFLRAQAELFQARASLAQARHGEVMATIQLARVTGELSLDWLQENMEMTR